MSMYTLTGKVINVYDRERQNDKGEKEVSHKVQVLGDMPVPGGDSRFEMVDLTCESQADFRPFLGKTIRVALGVFAPGRGQIIHFIPKGSKPEEVQA